MTSQTAPRTIDMTPTWSEISDLLLTVLENGNLEGKRNARLEVRRMARLADVGLAVLGGHRRPDAPAIPEAETILNALRDAAGLLAVYSSGANRVTGPNAATDGQARATVRDIMAILKTDSVWTPAARAAAQRDTAAS